MLTQNCHRIRRRAGFLLLSGIIPRRPVRLLPKTKKKPPRNFDIYLEVVLEELRELYNQGFFFFFSYLSWSQAASFFLTRLEVMDASLGRTVQSRVYLMFCNADIRAFPHLNAQTSAPAISGACDQCEQQGTRLDPDDRTIYGGYYRFVFWCRSSFELFISCVCKISSAAP